MRRRSHLAVTFVALLTVGASIVGSNPRDSALGADPLADARAERAALEQQLGDQQASLTALRVVSTKLSNQLDVAAAELAQVSAEYERVAGLLAQVSDQVAEITARLASLRAQIEVLDQKLGHVGMKIAEQTAELHAREALLQDHLRAAYEQSQTSLLEVLLSSETLDAATNQVGYLLNVSEQDQALADEIKVIRADLTVRQETLRLGRAALARTRAEAAEEAAALRERKAELAELERRTAELKAAAAAKRAEQEAALNAALEAQGNVEAQVAQSEQAFAAANQLVGQLEAQAAALEEARRRAAEEAARRAQEASAAGFRWPEGWFRVTQEWGPTSFRLEPPYTYQGVYYPHFHGAIDIAAGCGTEIVAAGTGVVVASGRPLWPWDTGYGVVIDHGDGIKTWYWHIEPRVIVSPGQPVTIGQVIGYEGTTGNSTGCHLHFAVNDNGVWENPRNYLP